MNYKYADTVITNPSDYSHTVVLPVKEAEDGIYNPTEDETPDFYSVYGVVSDNTIECFGDHSTKEEAEAYAAEISDAYNIPTKEHMR